MSLSVGVYKRLDIVWLIMVYLLQNWWMMGRYLIKELNSVPPLAGLYITPLMGACEHLHNSTRVIVANLPLLFFVRASTVTFKTPLVPFSPTKGLVRNLTSGQALTSLLWRVLPMFLSECVAVWLWLWIDCAQWVGGGGKQQRLEYPTILIAYLGITSSFAFVLNYLTRNYSFCQNTQNLAFLALSNKASCSQ